MSAPGFFAEVLRNVNGHGADWQAVLNTTAVETLSNCALSWRTLIINQT